MGGLSRGLAAGILVLSAGLGLVACTNAAPEPTGVTSAPPEQPAPEAEPTDVGAIAVVSIAAVDVDGVHVTVAGFVTQAAEDEGACRFVLTSEVSGQEVSVDAVGLANVDTTSCGTTQVATSELSRGPWVVVLEYQSAETVAVSEPLSLEVP